MCIYIYLNIYIYTYIYIYIYIYVFGDFCRRIHCQGTSHSSHCSKRSQMSADAAIRNGHDQHYLRYLMLNCAIWNLTQRLWHFGYVQLEDDFVIQHRFPVSHMFVPAWRLAAVGLRLRVLWIRWRYVWEVHSTQKSFFTILQRMVKDSKVTWPGVPSLPHPTCLSSPCFA